LKERYESDLRPYLSPGAQKVADLRFHFMLYTFRRYSHWSKLVSDPETIELTDEIVNSIRDIILIYL